MGHHFQVKSTVEQHAILEGQIRQSFGCVVYTHKAHEKCADILLERLAFIKKSQIVLSALATGGFISTLFGIRLIGSLIGGGVSFCLLVLNAYTKDYDLGELAQKHRQAAAELWLIREQYLSLLTDILIDRTGIIEDFQCRRDILIKQLHSVYLGAPSTDVKGYQRAQIGLQKKEELTFSDEEIDNFLPNELKKASNTH